MRNTPQMSRHRAGSNYSFCDPLCLPSWLQRRPRPPARQYYFFHLFQRLTLPTHLLRISFICNTLIIVCTAPQWLVIPCTWLQPLLIVSFPSPAPATPVSLIPDVPHLCFPPLFILPVFALSPARLLCVLSLVSIHSWPVCFVVKTFDSQTWSRTVLLHLSLPVWSCDIISL